MIKRIFKELFIEPRLFYAFGVVVVCFLAGFVWDVLIPIAQLGLIGLTAALLVDAYLVLSGKSLSAIRKTPKILSLGDAQSISLTFTNPLSFSVHLEIIDELPEQLQMRDFKLTQTLPKRSETVIEYDIRPLSRGEYHFGKILTYRTSPLGLLQRKESLGEPQLLKVYPSVIQMRKMELQAFTRVSSIQGLRKIRRIGHSYEFEQIKNYVRGDDFRSLNWKATGRMGELMVNQYEDEKSQHIYSIIDKSRAMKLPFNGLTLMEHSINTALAISNIILKKHDKAGLITFSDLPGSMIQADRGKKQLPRIMETLYNEKERKTEAGYERLYHAVTRMIRTRSLLFLYTNFESSLSVNRIMPILRKLNKRHLLVVVFFENTEVTAFSKEPASDIKDIFLKTIARSTVADKEQIVQNLGRFGIQAILTKPEDLALNTVNKYLELKARGMI